MSGSWLVHFPNLRINNYEVTSPITPRYNCIAWDAGSNTKFWWLTDKGYWPDGVPKEVTVSAFEKAFNSLGYERCQNGTLEDGYEKIVLYAKFVNKLIKPTHAAKQLRCGR